MTFVNENWYYLYLLGEDETVTVVPPYSTVELSSYFTKYEKFFNRRELTDTPTYTPYSIGSEVMIYSSEPEIDGQIGTIVGKDEISYLVDLGTIGSINFPYSVVELTNPTDGGHELPSYNGVILYYR